MTWLLMVMGLCSPDLVSCEIIRAVNKRRTHSLSLARLSFARTNKAAATRPAGFCAAGCRVFWSTLREFVRNFSLQSYAWATPKLCNTKINITVALALSLAHTRNPFAQARPRPLALGPPPA